MNKYVWTLLTLLAVVFLAAGCGPGGPRLYKAGGTVTYKDKPLENAIVSFFYDDGSAASGLTDASGKYELAYLGRPGGTAAGKCTVSVVQAPPATSAPAATGKMELSKMSPEEMKNNMKIASPQEIAAKAAINAPATLPARYGDPKTSGLQFEVQTNNNNDFPIVLKD